MKEYVCGRSLERINSPTVVPLQRSTLASPPSVELLRCLRWTGEIPVSSAKKVFQPRFLSLSASLWLVFL
ncbi:hypothetical protein AOLI_G00196990 [Acnodon oligacanthus]